MEKNIFNGIVFKGCGVASSTIKTQIPFLKNCAPDIASFEPRTINVFLPKQVHINSLSFDTGTAINWSPKYPPERFGLIRSGIRIYGTDKFIDAFIYLAFNSPHRRFSYIAEIVAKEFISGLNNGSFVELQVREKCLETEDRIIVG